jgi:type I restriction enzyme R subunit
MERSGVVWHTQGSGKSLTMVMLIRKLRTIQQLRHYKVLMVNDRTDLEEQLGGTATLTDEKVDFVENKKELREKLSTPSSNLVMVMIHKFGETTAKDDTMVDQVLHLAAEHIPRYGTFGGVNEAENILILIDEAHRTQGSDLGNSLFEAFPNSTKIAFTGTPLITDRHKKKTHEKFGTYIDKYKLQDAVDDGATLQILYEGKASDDTISEKHLFEAKFENLVKDRTPKEQALIRRKYGTFGDVLESEDRISAIATDLVNHYTDHVLPGGFKAQVVATSVLAAVRYKQAIIKAINERLEQEKQKQPLNEELIKKLAFLKVEAVVSSQGTNEQAIITEARKSAMANKAVENFKEKFNYEKPLTGIAILVVCDMLLTGFDAPVEQIMYMDKKMKEHSLLQAIARVNRTSKGKTRGYVVDYIGNTNNLKEALKIYAEDDQEDILQSFRDIATEIPVLQQRYLRLLQHFEEAGIKRIRAWVEQTVTDPREEIDILEAAVVKGEDVQFRAHFDVYFKAFSESMDIVLPNAAANIYKVPAKRFGWILFKMRQRYKDESISLEGIGEKIKQLINEHLVNLGVNPKVPPVELFSDNFEEEVNRNTSKKAAASEMEHAIRKHIKVNLQDDPEYYQKLWEKLEAIIKQHQDDYDRMVLELFGVREEAVKGRQQTEEGVSLKAMPFYDTMMKLAFNGTQPDAAAVDTCKQVIHNIIELLERTIGIIGFWQKGDEIRKLKGDITDILLLSNSPELEKESDAIALEILNLAKRRHDDLVKGNG